MYYYESHLGGIYTSDEFLDFDDLYCEECGDCDRYLGQYDSDEEFRKDYPEYIEDEGD